MRHLCNYTYFSLYKNYSIIVINKSLQYENLIEDIHYFVYILHSMCRKLGEWIYIYIYIYFYIYI